MELARTFTLTGELMKILRYGENPYMQAGLYRIPGIDDPLGVDKFRVIEGEPGFINMTDIHRMTVTLTKTGAAFSKFKDTAGRVSSIIVCVKHGNPCGTCASFIGSMDAVKGAMTGDTRALYGGSVMCNFTITKALAEAMKTAGLKDRRQMLDCVIAPRITPNAISVLSRRESRCKIVMNPNLATHSALLDDELQLRPVRGGFMLQSSPSHVLDFNDPDMVVSGERNACNEKNLALAWAVGSSSTSNTITIVKDGRVVGNGVGQQDRIGAAELAIKRAIDAGHGNPELICQSLVRAFQLYLQGAENIKIKAKELAMIAIKHAVDGRYNGQLKGAVACSDSFFPFPDGPQVLIDAGIKAVFATSGSKRDDEVRAAFKKGGVVFYQLPDRKARGFSCH